MPWGREGERWYSCRSDLGLYQDPLTVSQNTEQGSQEPRAGEATTCLPLPGVARYGNIMAQASHSLSVMFWVETMAGQSEGWGWQRLGDLLTPRLPGVQEEEQG